MATKLTIKQGEAKTVTFTVTDADGAAADLSAATLLLGVKKDKLEATYTICHEDIDFDKTQAASGIVAVDFTMEDTDQAPGTYVGELKCIWDGPVVKKSVDFYLKIDRAVTGDDEECEP